MEKIQVNGTTIAYRWDGPDAGDVVLMAHSLASDLRMWDPQVSPLVAAGYRVLRYDHRGHGRSEVSLGPYTMDMLADDAVGLIDGLGVDQVHFVGLSMGGMVGQVLGASHGKRLRSLTLSSTSSHMPPASLWDERIATVGEHGPGAVADGTIDRWFTPAGQNRLPEAVAQVRDTILATSADGFCACCAAIRDMDLRKVLDAVTTPTLITVGVHDEGTPVSAARFIHEHIVESRLVVVSDAAHMLNIEQEAFFNQTLLEFLKSTSDQTR